MTQRTDERGRFQGCGLLAFATGMAAGGCGLLAIPFAALLFVLFAPWVPSIEDREAFIAHHEPLVRALHAFEADRGEPPLGLDELVPEYLPSRLPPASGELGAVEYSLHIYEDDGGRSRGRSRFWWYDLGITPEWSSGEWPGYPRFGHGEVPVLLLRIDEGERVGSVRWLGEPWLGFGAPFDAELWKESRPHRWPMLAEVLKLLDVPGASLRELEATLGPPDGDQWLKRSWSLRSEIVGHLLLIDDYGYMLYEPCPDDSAHAPAWHWRQH